MRPSQIRRAADLNAGKTGVISDETQLHSQYDHMPGAQRRPQGIEVPISGMVQRRENPAESAGYGIGMSLMKEGTPITEEDRRFAIQNQYVDENGDVPGYGKAFVGDKFIEWAKKKEEEAFAYQFRDYVYKQIKLDTPQEREFWTKRFPEWTDRVMDAYEQQAEIDKRLKLIAVKGVENEYDLWLLYLRDRKILKDTPTLMKNGGPGKNGAYPGVRPWDFYDAKFDPTKNPRNKFRDAKDTVTDHEFPYLEKT